jgi:Sigma-70, region 4
VDEVREFCRRMLGPGAPAEAVAARADATAGDRAGRLAAAVALCRTAPSAGMISADRPPVAGDEPEAAPDELLVAVARELALATERLPERQREVLALRELLRLSHEQIAQVLGLEPEAVAPLLARARLGLRAERRGSSELGTHQPCDERDRTLRILARRQDAEPLSAQDDERLFSHLSECSACEAAHAAMLEASVCYRAWSA